MSQPIEVLESQPAQPTTTTMVSESQPDKASIAGPQPVNDITTKTSQLQEVSTAMDTSMVDEGANSSNIIPRSEENVHSPPATSKARPSTSRPPVPKYDSDSWKLQDYGLSRFHKFPISF